MRPLPGSVLWGLCLDSQGAVLHCFGVLQYKQLPGRIFLSPFLTRGRGVSVNRLCWMCPVVSRLGLLSNACSGAKLQRAGGRRHFIAWGEGVGGSVLGCFGLQH